jgi:hypothetical protein
MARSRRRVVNHVIEDDDGDVRIMPSRGKTFETEIHKMLKVQPWVGWIHRPPDRAPTKGMRFLPPNPIDLLGCIRVSGRGLMVECKAHSLNGGKSISFSRFFSRNEKRKKGSKTSFSQWGALYRCWRSGCHVQIALNVHGQTGRHGMRGEAYLVPFSTLMRVRQRHRGKRKSWPLGDLLKHATPLEKVAGGWAWPDQFARSEK